MMDKESKWLVMYLAIDTGNKLTLFFYQPVAHLLGFHYAQNVQSQELLDTN